MSELDDGSSVEVQGSGTATYVLKNTGGVYSCSCPAWRYQNVAAEARTCKHLRAFRGDAAEDARVAAFGGAAKTQATPKPPAATAAATTASSAAPAVVKAPPLLLAHRWDVSIPIKGWWMSEKLDGMRAYWDGSAFFSRLGNPISAPDWFCEGLPDFALDGELWMARKKFQETVSIVRRQDQSGDWKQVTYQVFDAPGISGPFEDRIEAATQAFAKSHPTYAVVLPQVTCSGITELQSELDRITALGGEGLMMRKPGSQYVAGRSNTLLKVKSFFDAEAKVTGHEAGKGKHKGRLGALDCELPDGTRFHVGTGFSDQQRENPPAIGAIVTFRFQELTKDGVPRFPSFVGERHDVAWPTQWPPAMAHAIGDAAASPIAAKPAAVAAQPKPPGQVPAAAPAQAKPPAQAPATAPAQKPHAASPAPAQPTAAANPVPAAPLSPEPIVGPPPPQPEAPAVVPEPAGTPGFRRHFEAMSKFWEIEVRGSEVWTRFGRVGSHGQPRCKSFADETSALQWAEEQAAKKVAIGFVEV